MSAADTSDIRHILTASEYGGRRVYDIDIAVLP